MKKWLLFVVKKPPLQHESTSHSPELDGFAFNFYILLKGFLFCFYFYCDLKASFFLLIIFFESLSLSAHLFLLPLYSYSNKVFLSFSFSPFISLNIFSRLRECPNVTCVSEFTRFYEKSQLELFKFSVIMIFAMLEGNQNDKKNIAFSNKQTNC